MRGAPRGRVPAVSYSLSYSTPAIAPFALRSARRRSLTILGVSFSEACMVYLVTVCIPGPVR